MIPWKKICCALDFSESSDDAFDTAIEIAQQFGAALTLLHVDQLPGYTLPDGPAFASAETLARHRASQQRALDLYSASARERGLQRVGVASRLGDPAAEIVRFAEEGGYDLIIVGTHGYRGLRHALMGSVAEKVVRTSSCPVLSVHRRERLEAHPPH